MINEINRNTDIVTLNMKVRLSRGVDQRKNLNKKRAKIRKNVLIESQNQDRDQDQDTEILYHFMSKIYSQNREKVFF